MTPEATDDEVRDPVFTGPGTLAGRLMRSFWQPVRLTADVKPGEAMPLTVMSEQFTLYRGEDGRAVLMAPRCAHRLTVLSVGTVEGDGIRCMFHGWKYGADGRCVEAPGESDRLVARVSVRAYPVHEQWGLIFAYLGEGEPPAFPELAGFSREHGHDITTASVLEADTYRRRCNFFTNVENGLDHAHVPFTHRLSADPTRTRSGFDASAAHQEPIEVRRSAGAVYVREKSRTSPYRATFLMPNGLHLIVAARGGMMEQFAWRVPIDDDTHFSYQVAGRYLPPEAAREYLAARAAVSDAGLPSADECAEQILRGEKRLADFVDHPGLINIEDHVAQVGMGRLADRTNETLGESDKGVVQLRRMWRTGLDAFADGKAVNTLAW
jgi:phenylpropionate dioxygenase-like ring-hydroxylating dioxygenase large terminal subunit